MVEIKEYPKFRWFVMVSMIVGVIAQGVIMIAPAPLIGEVAKYLDRDLGLITFTVMGLWTVTVCIGGMIGGALSDKVGVAKIYLICSLLLIVSAACTPLVGKSLGAIIVLRLIGGLGTGPIITTISRMVSEWFPVRMRPVISGVQGMAVALGIAVGFGLAPAAFASTQSWPVTMVFMAIPAAIFTLFSLVMVFGPKAPELVLEEHEDPDAGAKDFKMALKDPTIYLLVAYIFLFNWALQAINDLTPGYFAIAPPVGLGWGPAVSGKLMMLFTAMFMIGSLVSGWMLRYIYRGNTKVQIMLAFLLTATYFFVRFEGVTGQGPNPLLVILMAVSGFFLGQGISPCMGFIARTYPEHITGRVGGLAMGLGLIGGTVGIGAGSSALTATGTYQVSILIVTIVAIVGFVLAMWLKPPKVFAGLLRRD